MSSPPSVRIGARGSPLSLAQTGLVRDALAAANPGRTFEIVPIVTTGDRLQDAGGKGLFTKELDEAMLGGRIELAVHSMKDLPTQLPDDIVLAGVPPREDPRDALICAVDAHSLRDLPERSRIGTASLRRQAQLLSLRPSFRISMLRGNVETRLRKVAEGEVDATLLAYSGLRRLRGDEAMAAVLAPVEDLATRLEITAERAFLAALDGSCRTPIAALGRWSQGVMRFIGETLTPDGAECWRRTAQEPCATEAAAALLGERLGHSIRAEAGDRLYRE